jgi:hypothetical protein
VRAAVGHLGPEGTTDEEIADLVGLVDKCLSGWRLKEFGDDDDADE